MQATVAWQVSTAADIMSAERLIFPGVGAFEQAMGVLSRKDFTEPLREYIQVRTVSYPCCTCISFAMQKSPTGVNACNNFEWGDGMELQKGPDMWREADAAVLVAVWAAFPGHLFGYAAAL